MLKLEYMPERTRQVFHALAQDALTPNNPLGKC
jgi:hypothetical protein